MKALIRQIIVSAKMSEEEVIPEHLEDQGKHHRKGGTCAKLLRTAFKNIHIHIYVSCLSFY